MNENSVNLDAITMAWLHNRPTSGLPRPLASVINKKDELETELWELITNYGGEEAIFAVASFYGTFMASYLNSNGMLNEGTTYEKDCDHEAFGVDVAFNGYCADEFKDFGDVE